MVKYGISMKIELPLIKLRKYQRKAWTQIAQAFRDGKRMAMLVWHRRAGKDLFCLNFLINEAVQTVGNYWYILPEAQQVRKAIWEGVTHDGKRYLDFFPKELVLKQDDQSMSVYLRHPKGGLDNKGKPKVGSIVSFVGGDRYDKRVGAGIKGAVVSELALQKPNLYDLALEPMLRETNGWVLFNTTPRGENHAYDMLEFLRNHPEEGTQIVLSVDDTATEILEESGVDLLKGIESERKRGKAEEIIQQEYFCSFEGAIHGSYYGDILKTYKDNVMNVPYDGGLSVDTMWDLGVSDSTSIWFVQFVGREVRVIDYYEASGYGLSHYADVLKNKGYSYSKHHLPHDGNQRQLTSTERALTIKQQLANLGLNDIQITPRTNDVYNDIQATRNILSRCVFDKVKTKDGYESLKQYRREFDEKRNTFKNSPLHDWTSHGADAFRILPKIVNKTNIKSWKAKRYKGM